MRAATVLAAALPVLGASARLIGVKVPSTIAPGDTFTAIMINEIYIQTVYDVAIAFGIDTPPGHEGYIGQVVGSQYLGPALSNQGQNLNLTVTMPSSAQKGTDQVFYAALYSLYGVSSGPTISSFNVTTTIGEVTSDDYVSSL
ncbi:signal peptide-containing protein [Diplodia corticola]|uniref:Signal peptide-containing protein n=1 Tax=Diplodia corticola TaxID=236234 RepID=A0A1J9QS54_9PEZI|nr:signal peptide-containing protein [Diplodia corticola]OJD31790.1 signal peptide-containing protein [Diplodia corticola]